MRSRSLADILTKYHHLADTTFGEGTPFGEMINTEHILLVLAQNNISQVHSAEDLLKNLFSFKIIYR